MRQQDDNNVHTRRRQDPSTIYIQVPSISQNNNNNNIFHATRRHQPPLSTPSPRPKNPPSASTPQKNEGTNTLMGQYQKHIRNLTHTNQTPTVTRKFQNPESHKAKSHLPQKKMPPHNQPGGKRGGENLLGGYDESTRTRSQRSLWWW